MSRTKTIKEIDIHERDFEPGSQNAAACVTILDNAFGIVMILDPIALIDQLPSISHLKVWEGMAGLACSRGSEHPSSKFRRRSGP